MVFDFYVVYKYLEMIENKLIFRSVEIDEIEENIVLKEYIKIFYLFFMVISNFFGGIIIEILICKF